MTPGPILVVAAHPDDEALGCGGTMARLSAERVAVNILFLGDGETSRFATASGAKALRAIADRQRAARAAAKILGARPPHFADFPDNRFDRVPLLDIVRHIETAIARVRPASIFTHHGGDLNVDHRIVHQAVVTACRPLPGSTVSGIYTFETLSSTEWSSEAIGPAFRPRCFVDIDSWLDTKLRALDCYPGEMRPFPHARSRDAVIHQARLRGATAGLAAAEAFDVIREIVI